MSFERELINLKVDKRKMMLFLMQLIVIGTNLMRTFEFYCNDLTLKRLMSRKVRMKVRSRLPSLRSYRPGIRLSSTRILQIEYKFQSEP